MGWIGLGDVGRLSGVHQAESSAARNARLFMKVLI